MYTDKCKYYEVPYAVYSDRESLGRAVGKDLRSALAVKDEGLCRETLCPNIPQRALRNIYICPNTSSWNRPMHHLLSRHTLPFRL